MLQKYFKMLCAPKKLFSLKGFINNKSNQERISIGFQGRGADLSKTPKYFLKKYSKKCKQARLQYKSSTKKNMI